MSYIKASQFPLVKEEFDWKGMQQRCEYICSLCGFTKWWYKSHLLNYMSRGVSPVCLYCERCKREEKPITKRTRF